MPEENQQQAKRQQASGAAANGKPAATVIRLTTCSSSLKKPASSFKAPAFSSSSNQRRASCIGGSSSQIVVVGTGGGGGGASNATAASRPRSRLSSQSSLLSSQAAAAGKCSGSRTSLMSDTTTVSVCSSLPPASTCSAASTSTTSNRANSNINNNGNGKSVRSSAASPAPTLRPTKPLGSTASAASARRVPTLAMSLRDKDQQIKLLIKERDEQRIQAEMMARKAEEWEEKFRESELEKSHVTSEADDEVVELRRLSQELEDENKKLATQLGEKELQISDAQFKLDELECERSELRRELDEKEDQLSQMERENQELADGKPIIQVTTERTMSKQKFEREIEELKERILSRDEQMMQLRSSLEMRKNEVANLQAHSGDLERKLKIADERNERHLKRIDEINLELKAAEAKLASKTEENDMYERQVKSLRQELRAAEEKLEQISLARKKDVDVLHSKLSAARRGSTTPTSPQPSNSFKTPTPQDELVRLQMEIRDLKDQLIDREAELDCNRRDIEVMRRKMETRTLEVDCNNQELARRCQDLLEQNRQSEDTVKQLLKSSTEHSTQLMRATEDLKEANAKCVGLREEVQQLEAQLDRQLARNKDLADENGQLAQENSDYKQQVEALRQQVDSLNEQLGELCEQLDVQTNTLHKDREALAQQLAHNDIDLAQMRHDLDRARQDLRSGKLQVQEVANERDRLKVDLDMKDKYVASRNDIIETLRHELEDGKKSLLDYKQRLETLRHTKDASGDSTALIKDLKSQLELVKRELQKKEEETSDLSEKCQKLQLQLKTTTTTATAATRLDDDEEEEEDELRKFDEMRQKHSAELDELRLKLKDLEDQLEEAKSATLKHRQETKQTAERHKDSNKVETGSQQVDDSSGSRTTTPLQSDDNRKLPAESNGGQNERKDEYESQIEFLNSVVVDMQRKCDDYKTRLSQVETMNIMKEFDNLILFNQPLTLNDNQHHQNTSRASTLRRPAPPQLPAPSTMTLKGVNKLPISNGGLRRPDGSGPITITSTATLNRPRYVNGSPASRVPYSTAPERPVRISGRPYCDICSIYDQHHTIYCPKVSEKLAARRVDSLSGGSGGSQSSESSVISNSKTINIINNNNNNNNNNNYNTIVHNNNNNTNSINNNEAGFDDAVGLNADAVNDMFREYEQSIDVATVEQYSTLRRLKLAEKPPRAYCDHCDLFGHTIKSCNSLKSLDPHQQQQQSHQVQ